MKAKSVLVPTAACLALGAAIFANVARAEDAVTPKEGAMAEHMSDHPDAMKMHDKKHMSKDGAMSGHMMEHMAPKDTN